MLFATRPSDFIYKDMEVITMEHFPFKGYKAMSWCGKIIHRKGVGEVDSKTLNHESIHVLQACYYAGDSWTKYYIMYLWEWLRYGFIAPISANYYVSKWESQAYAHEDDVNYCLEFVEDDIDKYSVKRAKKKWRELGGTSRDWKSYIKTL